MNMEDCSKKNGETCPKLLDFISKERKWLCKGDNIKFTDDSKLELKLGPPGEERDHHSHHEPLLLLGCFSNGEIKNQPKTTTNPHHNFEKPHGVTWFMQQQQQLQGTTGPQRLPIVTKESSQNCCTKVTGVVDMQQQQQTQQQQQQQQQAGPANTAVPNSSQKRNAPSPVVGWPPIRSFRKNLAAGSGSSKQTLDTQNGSPSLNPYKKVATGKPVPDTFKKGSFVKINMDGVPIGRKVDLKAYDSYEKLSVAVDELFRGLLAAQRDSSGDGIMISKDENEAGILKGSGEYTLVYEDNEGDRMLVGDVPWHMFVSTVKRLRVLKSSEVSALSFGASKQEKIKTTQALK